jgi:selenocysteine lyase/cysteine desulfurase
MLPASIDVRPAPTPVKRAFLDRHPDYLATRRLDQLRAEAYARLDHGNHVYLDYSGGGLYAEQQVRAHERLLRRAVFGNPHSTNPTSLAATELVERTRACVLDYFNASPEDYLVIFTPNASGALKLLGESYPFAPGGRFLLTVDNHNSVNGIREYAAGRGARVGYAPVTPPALRLEEAALETSLGQAGRGAHNLFAYPAQSNFSGVQHSLAWIERAHSKGWDVLLDAAAFVPTNRLDLSRYHPDYVSLSFYKMFGYPTGIGALIVRRAAFAKLRRPWFSGGTVALVSVRAGRHLMRRSLESFEDGTLNYLGIPAVEIGLKHLAEVEVDLVHTRVRCLTAWLLDSLAALRHPNGRPAVEIYGPPDTRARGGTLSFNFYDAGGRPVDFHDVERRANQANISLRTGCFCNPGASEVAFGLSAEDLEPCFSECPHQVACDDLSCCLPGRLTGAVRVSLGIVSNFVDICRFMEFARTFVDG